MRRFTALSLIFNLFAFSISDAIAGGVSIVTTAPGAGLMPAVQISPAVNPSSLNPSDRSGSFDLQGRVSLIGTALPVPAAKADVQGEAAFSAGYEGIGSRVPNDKLDSTAEPVESAAAVRALESQLGVQQAEDFLHPSTIEAMPAEARIDLSGVARNRERASAGVQTRFRELASEFKTYSGPTGLAVNGVSNKTSRTSYQWPQDYEDEGRTFSKKSAEPPVPSSSQLDEKQKKALRTYLWGVGAFKVGMEAMRVAVPLIALTTFKTVTSVAALVAIWGVSQAIASSLSGRLFEKYAPQRIAAISLVVQAVAIAGMFGLLVSHAFLPALVMPLYFIGGAAQGVTETARRVIPPAIVGKDVGELETFNSKTHIAYEVAGVVGAVAAGLALGPYGLAAALAIHPLAYLVSAFVINRINLGAPAPVSRDVSSDSGAIKPGTSVRNRIADWFKSIGEAAKTIWTNPVLRWASLAMLIPQIMHRISEGIIFPVYAKTVIMQDSSTAWLLGTCNLGELLGAVVLLKLALVKGWSTAGWVRSVAITTLGFWFLSGHFGSWILLPFVALQSLVLAAADLKLNSYLQSRPEIQAREQGFLYAVYLGAVTLLSFGVGWLYDAIGTAPGIFWMNVFFTAVSGWLLMASYQKKYKGGK